MIEEITIEHIEDCANLYVDVFNAEPWNDKWTYETAKIRLTDIVNSPNFVGIMYKEEGIIKGAIFGNYEQFYDGLHYNLREMFVLPEMQGLGIGSLLLKELEKNLKKRDVTLVILFTSKGNRTSKFYWKNDFHEWTSMAMMGKEI